MKTRIRSTKSASHSTSSTEAATVPATPVVATPPAATAPAAGSIIFLDPPPASANIPSPPKDWVASSNADYRNLLPRKTELAALPGAIKDLTRFTTYTQTLGAAAPPVAHVLQSLTSASAWSSMRTVTSAWDQFSAAQEGVGWTMARSQMDLLRPIFSLAVSHDPQLAVELPSLAALLGAKQAIAQRAASTKKANAQAIAKGEQPTHGLVGKKRKRAAEKAAYAAGTGSAPAPTAPVAGAPVLPTPVAAGAAPATEAASPAPVGAASTVGHS